MHIFPGKPPFPLLHIDTTWKFKEIIEFRDQIIKKLGLELLIHVNQDGVDQGIGPFSHGSKKHTDVIKTDGLKQALDKYQFDAAFGGARRDEEKSRAKERVYSFRDKNHRWDPKNQRPELWNIYNGEIDKGASKIKSIETYDGELEQAFAPMAVTLILEDEIDISRGDMLVGVEQTLATVSDKFKATIVWMTENALAPGRQYIIKLATR